LTGWITRIVRARACGFIRAADGQDVFFHASELVNAKFNDITDDLAVEFTLVRDDVSGPRAAQVRVDRRDAMRDTGRTSSDASPLSAPDRRRGRPASAVRGDNRARRSTPQ